VTVFKLYSANILIFHYTIQLMVDYIQCMVLNMEAIVVYIVLFASKH